MQFLLFLLPTIKIVGYFHIPPDCDIASPAWEQDKSSRCHILNPPGGNKHTGLL